MELSGTKGGGIHFLPLSFCPLKNNSYICNDLHNEWRVTLASLVSIFYAYKIAVYKNIAALYPRVEKLMLSLPFIGVGQRERQSRFSFA